MSRRSNGEGTIKSRRFTHPDGKHYIRHFARLGVKDPLTGQTRYRDGPLREKLSEADSDRKRMSVELSQGLLRPSGSIQLAHFLQEWLERRKKDLSPKGWREYELDIRLHIAPGLGKIKLDRLEPLQIIAWQDALEERCSPWVAKKARACLQSALTDAVYWQLILRNPCDTVRNVRLPAQEGNIWEPHECEAFLETAHGSSHHLAYYLTLNLGLRIGELRGLQWSDFSLIGGVMYLRVQRQNTSDASTPVFGPTKGKKERVLDVTEDVIQLLQEHKHGQEVRRTKLAEQWKDYELVITTGHGTPVSTSRLRKAFYSLAEKARLPFLKFHELRHSAGSIWLARGMTLEQVSFRLGHSSVKVTERVYLHQLKKAPQPFGMSMHMMLKGEVKGEMERKSPRFK
jgi:integrase